MVERLIIPLAYVVIASLWSVPLSAEPASHATLVLERVIDGDTFVASGLKIRLWGIDAPERSEPLYQHSRLVLEQILRSGALSCSPVDRDRYDRVVMQCRSDETDIGSLMVRAGYARDYARYSKGFYGEEQDAAQSSGTGIWQ
jgi:endonuclease YncB( thermonuclease family)